MIEQLIKQETVPYYETLKKVRSIVENTSPISETFPRKCCKHSAKFVKQKVNEEQNENVVEFVGWNAFLNGPHALTYDKNRELFLDITYQTNKVKDGIYISKEMPFFLSTISGGGIVEDNPEDNLVKNFLNRCNKDYFVEQMELLNIHYDFKYNQKLIKNKEFKYDKHNFSFLRILLDSPTTNLN